MTDKSINAGVDALTGFALQRNTALYLLLENYSNKFKDNDYFICLEHQDDFVFCFLNENNEADIIEAYQSKKKSPSSWELNKELYNIIIKILKTGKNLIKDEIPKSNTYKHNLYFSTNSTINLKVFEKKKIEASVSIKADNINVEFITLEDKIKDKIISGVNDSYLKDELDNLNFIFIDLNQSAEKQENELVGQVDKVFGDKIQNHRAAVKALIELFREIEEKYNQGNQVKLLDSSKRVTSSQIKDAFKILTTKTKCFGYWRDYRREISKTLEIKPSERDEFEFAFISSFDFFKSIKEAEHQMILNFVKSNISRCTTFTDEENVKELFDIFNENKLSRLGVLELKAILFAALFETINKNKK
jgi:hypothetical protein